MLFSAAAAHRMEQCRVSSIDHTISSAEIGNRLEPASGGRPVPADSKAQTNSERNADHLGRFLAAHRPALFCDDCIADKLGLSHRREANRVTRALGKTSNFWRDVGACSACERHKQVIRHV